MLYLVSVWAGSGGWEWAGFRRQQTAAEGNLIVIIICDAKTHLSIYIIHQFSITCNYLSFRKRKNPLPSLAWTWWTPTPPRPPSPPAYRLQLQQALINLNHCPTMNTFSLTAAGSGKVPTKKTSFSACSTWTPFHWTQHLLSRSPPVPSFPRCTSQPSGAMQAVSEWNFRLQEHLWHYPCFKTIAQFITS